MCSSPPYLSTSVTVYSEPSNQVCEDKQQTQDEKPADEQSCLVDAAHLLLARDGSLLQRHGSLRHAPIFGQVLTLRIANLCEEALYLVG